MQKELYELIKSKKVILMDFDGTITDTEPLNYMTWKEILKIFGIDFTKEDFVKIVGLPAEVIADKLGEKYGGGLSRETLVPYIPKYIEVFLDLQKKMNIQIFDYVIDLLKEFVDTPKYIVSNQIVEIINDLLDKWGVRDKFNGIISCLHLNLKKPEIYVNTKQYFNCEPNECVLFEDAPKYLLEGKKNGMATVGIQNCYNKIEKADYIIQTNTTSFFS